VAGSVPVNAPHAEQPGGFVAGYDLSCLRVSEGALAVFAVLPAN
jgi:hypothetical protein